MDISEQILNMAQKKGPLKATNVARELHVSRQYSQRHLKELVRKGLLVKLGSTRSAAYVIPGLAEQASWKYDKRFKSIHLEEHVVLEDIEKKSQFIRTIPENVKNIFEYAFSEILNNAIEHSQSSNIHVNVIKTSSNLIFQVNDFGIGVFRNVKEKRKLESELHAIQDLLKGKTSTQPHAHSGEGIFFTSKIADMFSLESYGLKLIVDNDAHKDIFIEEIKPSKKGTKVYFHISCASPKHLNGVFRKHQTDPNGYAFDKTEIKIRLFALGTVHVSRSQARRLLANLDKFKTIILDFDKVPAVGQAFADEIFRVFKNKFPGIKVTPVNMNKAVEFMVKRASG